MSNESPASSSSSPKVWACASLDKSKNSIVIDLGVSLGVRSLTIKETEDLCQQLVFCMNLYTSADAAASKGPPLDFRHPRVMTTPGNKQ